MNKASEDQLNLLGELFQKLGRHQASLDDSGLEIFQRVEEMLRSLPSKKEASEAIRRLDGLAKKLGNERRSVHPKQMTQQQGKKINSLQNRQKHCPDKIQEQISPLMKKFKDRTSRLSYDEADELIKLLDACQSPIPEDR
jgi:poly-D-alanine transfer protein DltD